MDPLVEELRGEVTAFPSERVEETVTVTPSDTPADDTAAV